MNGQEKEFAEVQKWTDSLLSSRGALKRLGVDTDSYYICMISHEFEYITSTIELTQEHKFSKFYKRVDNDEFVLCGVRVKRN